MEINFCPFCDASQHKVLNFNENLHFCKECDKFFNLALRQPSCPKCKSTNVVDSDFPSPGGEIIFHCNKCKKMYSAKEFLNSNKLA